MATSLSTLFPSPTSIGRRYNTVPGSGGGATTAAIPSTIGARRYSTVPGGTIGRASTAAAATTVSSSPTRLSSSQAKGCKPLSTEEEDLIRPMFDYHDRDRDGYLTANQARRLWGELGYPEKSDFRGSAISYHDFVYSLNNRRITGVLGKDDLEGRARRAYRMMVPSHRSSHKVSFDQFKAYALSLGIELLEKEEEQQNVLIGQVYELLCPAADQQEREVSTPLAAASTTIVDSNSTDAPSSMLPAISAVKSTENMTGQETNPSISPAAAPPAAATESLPGPIPFIVENTDTEGHHDAHADDENKVVAASECLVATVNNEKTEVDTSLSETQQGSSTDARGAEDDDEKEEEGLYIRRMTEEEFVKYVFKTVVKSRRAMHVFKD